jgi:hypothetical protein
MLNFSYDNFASVIHHDMTSLLLGMMYNSREMFNKWQAQRWWAENYDKVMELYNVQRFNHQSVPLPTTPKSEDEVRCARFITTCFNHYKSAF